MTVGRLEAAWTELMAPETGDVRADLVREAAEFLGLPLHDAWHRIRGAGERFKDEWSRLVTDPSDARDVMDFYNRSDTELFELIEWHATDPIHYRTLVLRDFALRQPGRSYLDYGSGIGSDALVFAHAGFGVTLADVSERLLAFAAFRCRRRGFTVRTIDLKREALPADGFDVAVCFDVLEHIPRPIRVVRAIRRAMRERGLLAVHAPFGEDPDRPMHVVHEDVVTPRMRSLGLQPVDCPFPTEVLAPGIYRKERTGLVDRLGYYVYDGYLSNALGARLAAAYRRARRRRPAAAGQQA